MPHAAMRAFLVTKLAPAIVEYSPALLRCEYASLIVLSGLSFGLAVLYWEYQV
jgi:hypothetical protein